jgi:hypothetical protein
MSILKKLFGIEDKPSQDTIVESETVVETKVVPKEEVGVPADGDQVVRGE